MNAFYEHYKDSIRFGYRCFDRILLNGLIQPFQQPERVVRNVNARSGRGADPRRFSLAPSRRHRLRARVNGSR